MERGIRLWPLNNPQNIGILENLLRELYRLSDSGFSSVSATQTLTASATVIPDARMIRVAGSGGAVTLTATPTISAGTSDGLRLTVIGSNDTNTVTFQRESALAGSKLRLGAATRVLGNSDVLELVWDNTRAAWIEVSFVDNT